MYISILFGLPISILYVRPVLFSPVQDQYMLIHDALAEYLLCPLTEIKQLDVKSYADRLSETPPDIMPSLLQNLFLVSVCAPEKNTYIWSLLWVQELNISFKKGWDRDQPNFLTCWKEKTWKGDDPSCYYIITSFVPGFLFDRVFTCIMNVVCILYDKL